MDYGFLTNENILLSSDNKNIYESATDIEKTMVVNPSDFPDIPYQKQKTKEDYELLKLLGEGSQGQVWKARNKETRQIVALKILDMKKVDKNLNSITDEIETLQKISTPTCHPFLACYYNSYYDPFEKLYLIEMEYIDGVTLQVWVQKYWDIGNFKALHHNLLYLTKDLGKALKFIHSKGIVHRDIKPENIMITNNNVPKLVDFGIACDTKICNVITENNSVKTCCKGYVGTPVFLSPEVIETGTSYPASDVWSLGSTLYYLATGNFNYEFGDKSSTESVMLTISRNEPFLLNTNNYELDEIVNNSTIKNPTERLTIEQILHILDVI